jgi:hypothetical protein
LGAAVLPVRALISFVIHKQFVAAKIAVAPKAAAILPPPLLSLLLPPLLSLLLL